MYWHVGQLVIISQRFTQVKNRQTASPPIFPVAMNYLHVSTSAQLSVVIQKWTH